MIKLILGIALAQAAPTTLFAAARREPSPVRSTTIPESGFQIRPCAYFFKIKSPKDFEVARPGSFQDMSHFKTDNLFFTVNRSVEAVWGRYMTINPLKIWSNPRSRIVAVYVPSMDRTLYRDDLATEWPGFEEGMKIFVDMSSLPVAVTNRPAMMVGLKITKIDAASRTVEFRYLEGTPSYGMQVIRFRAGRDNPNVTEITHDTWFRAYGALIERMYPFYHRKMIRGMHGRFKWEIEGEAAP
jgi:hypothetical protein